MLIQTTFMILILSGMMGSVIGMIPTETDERKTLGMQQNK